jgi:hypothetical protein
MLPRAEIQFASTPFKECVWLRKVDVGVILKNESDFQTEDAP